MKILRAGAPINIQPPETCPHDRLYTWAVRLIANIPESPRLICFGCCDCGHSFTRLAPGPQPDLKPYAKMLAEVCS
jgi:hypothetical protein